MSIKLKSCLGYIIFQHLKEKQFFSVEDATKAANDLPGPVYVVKAQIHAGGRGKAGGVKVVKDLDAVKMAAQSILGKKINNSSDRQWW